MWHIKLYNTLKNRRSAGIWKTCWLIHILYWIYCRSIVFHKALVIDGSSQYVQCAPYAEILQIFQLFSMIWYCQVLSPAVSKRQDVRWCNFRWSIQLSIYYVLESDVDNVISTPSCSYCIWNSYCQNHRSILANFPLFEWLYTVAFQSTAEYKRQDVRWCSFRWSIPLSIGYFSESGMDRIISTPSCSYCIWNRFYRNHRRILPNFLLLYDYLRMNSIACRVQTITCTMMLFLLIDSVIHCLCFEMCVLIWLSRLIYTHIAYEIVI